MRQVTSLFSRVAAAGLFSAVLVLPLQAQVLITEQEAALPAAADTGLTFRGVTRGPKVKIVSPAPGAGTVTSPLSLKLQFESFGGAKIDTSSVKASYLKSPSVDLTQRMMKYVKDNGIEMEGAIVPPGEHVIKVDLKDSEGRAGSASFKLNVAK
jgi:hypothetical protein